MGVSYEVCIHSNRNLGWIVSRMGIGGRTVAIHSSGQTIFGFTHIEGITLGADEKVDEVAGGAMKLYYIIISQIFDHALTYPE